VGKKLKKRAASATVLVLGGYGLSQLLRLGGNLIVTRLLVPEYFGIMAIAQVFLFALGLFSDIGLAPGVIRSNRSNDPTFLNTAWTLQVIRGLILWGLTVAIALPVAEFYHNPILKKILPVIGLVFFVGGFSSTSIFTLNKEVKLGKITMMELASQVAGLIVMVVLAYLYRSVWALVVGGLANNLFKTILSHFLKRDNPPSFRLEGAAVHELVSFGKWIFVSTAMMFLATQSDRLLLGKFLPLALFGVYNIAVMFAELPKQIISKLSNKVIFPLMTQVAELPRHEFRHLILQKRKLFLFPAALLIALFTGFGDVFIQTLYDQRYHQAAWMLPLLSLGMWPFLLVGSVDRCFYAFGNPKVPAAGNFLKFIYMITCVPLLFHFAGVFGGVLAVAMNDFPVYLVVSYGLVQEKMTCFRQDFLATLLLLFLLVVFYVFRLTLGMGGIPGRAVLG
jgi:O-antigen/teichoic acid export membrane protein